MDVRRLTRRRCQSVVPSSDEEEGVPAKEAKPKSRKKAARVESDAEVSTLPRLDARMVCDLRFVSGVGCRWFLRATCETPEDRLTRER